METPAPIRRNPSRKARISSTGKSSAKEPLSGRKLRGEVSVSSFHEAREAPIFMDGEIKRAVSTLPDEEIANALITTESSVDVSLSQKQAWTIGKLRVFVRIRPVNLSKQSRKDDKATANKNAKSRSKPASKIEVPGVCLFASGPDKVTLMPPVTISVSHKPKAEEFDGFTGVFGPDSSQGDVFQAVLVPLLIGLLRGESSLVVSMGPTGAGKTYTMFGNSGDPGLLPRCLEYLYLPENCSATMKIAISIFEIYSEQGGRNEKVLDLLQDATEIGFQNFKLRGLHEAVSSTAQEANNLLLSGLKRRTTASTAANNQSSRSHCVVNISISNGLVSKVSGELELSKKSTLTIADLAGFERERKTGNYGLRLNESNFINNTAMVFGQCLRALLEHQKHPRKALQKHTQYSLLTRYLKPYLEAKGNMTLVVNLSPCDENFLDSAYVLRQAAPYSRIKLVFEPSQETVNAQRKGRSPLKEGQPLLKRRKLHSLGTLEKKQQELTSVAGQDRELLQAEFSGLIVDLHENEGDSIRGLKPDNASLLESPSSNVVQGDCFFNSSELKQISSMVCAILHNAKVEGYVDISNAILGVVGQVLNQRIEFLRHLECKLAKQCQEMLEMTMKLEREKNHADDLTRELRALKEHCRILEHGHAIHEKASFPSLKVLSLESREEVEKPTTNVEPVEVTHEDGDTKGLGEREDQGNPGKQGRDFEAPSLEDASTGIGSNMRHHFVTKEVPSIEQDIKGSIDHSLVQMQPKKRRRKLQPLSVLALETDINGLNFSFPNVTEHEPDEGSKSKYQSGSNNLISLLVGSRH